VFSNSQEQILVTDLAIVVVEVLSDAEREAMEDGVAGAIDAAISTTPLVLTSKDVPPLPEIRDVVWCASFEVPKALAELPEWPHSGDFRPVTIYPKVLIQKVSVGWFHGLRLELAREAAREQDVGINFWQAPALKHALKSHGYPIAP
jgi:hypothetical protein